MKLPVGWESVSEAAFVDELRRELVPGHVLYGRSIVALARRRDRDDVAFLVDGTRLCIVHLTWSEETTPEWPHVEFVEQLTGDDDE